MFVVLCSGVEPKRCRPLVRAGGKADALAGGEVFVCRRSGWRGAALRPMKSGSLARPSKGCPWVAQGEMENVEPEGCRPLAQWGTDFLPWLGKRCPSVRVYPALTIPVNSLSPLPSPYCVRLFHRSLSNVCVHSGWACVGSPPVGSSAAKAASLSPLHPFPLRRIDSRRGALHCSSLQPLAGETT